MALVLGGIAAGSLALTFGVLQPRFATGEVGYVEMYRAWGRSLGEVVANLLRHPVRLAQWMVSTPNDAYDTALKQKYYLQMLLPVLFLPLLSPLTLAIALPILVEHFLSFRITQHMIVYQYTALVTPF